MMRTDQGVFRIETSNKDIPLDRNALGGHCADGQQALIEAVCRGAQTLHGINDMEDERT